MLKKYANEETPKVQKEWCNLPNQKRIEKINKIINQKFKNITLSRVNDEGQVFVILEENVNVAIRGSLLLDFEECIKYEIDEGLNVWCEPIGDKSSLRNLRGIKIKT